MDRAADLQIDMLSGQLSSKFLTFMDQRTSIVPCRWIIFGERKRRVRVHSFALFYLTLSCFFLFDILKKEREKERKFYEREEREKEREKERKKERGAVAGRSWWNCCVRDGLTQSPSKKKKNKKIIIMKKRKKRSEGKEEEKICEKETESRKEGWINWNSWYINIILKRNKCKEAAAKQLIYRFKVKKQNNN